MSRGITPTDAVQVVKGLLDVWDAAAERMIQAVARRLARGITTDGWAEAKAREVLAVRDELTRIADGLDRATPQLAAEALERAFELGAHAGKIVGQPIVTRPGVVAGQVLRLQQGLQGSLLPVIRAHADLYQRVTTLAEARLVSTGVGTRRDVVAAIVDELLAEGADRFTDSRGRRWALDTYARMAARSISGQTAVQGQLDTMRDDGRDVVQVSDSPRECPVCRPWEGRLLSITGETIGLVVDGRTVGATVAEAIAAGLHHPNCGHRLDPYTAGLTEQVQPTDGAKGYADQQHLRALERRARELKRRLAAATELGQTPTARRLRADIRQVGHRITAHTEQSGLNRRRDRERPFGPDPRVG